MHKPPLFSPLFMLFLLVGFSLPAYCGCFPVHTHDSQGNNLGDKCLCMGELVYFMPYEYCKPDVSDFLYDCLIDGSRYSCSYIGSPDIAQQYNLPPAADFDCSNGPCQLAVSSPSSAGDCQKIRELINTVKAVDTAFIRYVSASAFVIGLFSASLAVLRV